MSGVTRLAQRSSQWLPLAASCAQKARGAPERRAVLPNIAMGQAMWHITTSNGCFGEQRAQIGASRPNRPRLAGPDFAKLMHA